MISVIRLISLFLCVIYLFRSTQTQDMSAEPCPNVTVQKNFQNEDYLGVWYEYARTNSTFEKNAKCVFLEYFDNHNGSYKIVNTMINNLTYQPLSIQGEAKMASRDGDAKLTVQFPQAPFPGSYWVLETDYTSYSVVWGCNNFMIFTSRMAWIITRERNPTQEVINAAYAVLDKNNIRRSIVQVTDQKNCSDISEIPRNYF